MCDDVKFVNEKEGQSVDVGSPKDVEGVKETDSQKSCSRSDWALTLERKLKALERHSGTSSPDLGAQVTKLKLEWTQVFEWHERHRAGGANPEHIHGESGQIFS
ncbi:PREDICTED: PRUPE_3G026300 [Prunus dulcis]|uniref:PREDICTED: PRUPE_3G026300 n=1 Tax=Prunus dulcis TaxID=3755 RepID=A0A5E4G2D5_PRUDU|nr:PREDICTED: PRUPE_3G026300 [Prunus dulcis]